MDYSITTSEDYNTSMTSARIGAVESVYKLTIASPQNLTAFTALGSPTATGGLLAYDSEGSDGSQTLIGILAYDIDCSAGDMIADVIVLGEYREGKILDVNGDAVPAGRYQSGMILIKGEE